MKNKALNTKLSPGFKSKWVAALRSGNYYQNKDDNNLTHTCEQSYSAIGVALRLAGVRERQIMDMGEYASIQYPFFPKELLHGTELNNKITLLENKGMSFTWLASYIERYL